MRTLGSIKAILSDTHVLVQSDARLRVEQVLTVFIRLPVPEEKRPDVGLSEVLIPKGEIRVSVKQADDIYLAERFVTGTHQRSTGSSFSSPLVAIFGEQVEVKDWSAEWDKKQSLGLNIRRSVRVGDLVGDPSDIWCAR